MNDCILAPADHAALDADLLSAFRERGSTAAFTALVERYAGMVHGTCRRTLGDGHPLLEDACQAVFLVLLRHPGRVREPAALPGWLYWQARRIAGNARRSEERRRRRELEASPPSPTPPPHGPWDDIAPLLDQAISSLSGLQREAVVRHFLGGESHAELARGLGVSETATKKRVADALGRLRAFFSSRGVAIGSVALAAALSEASAAPPPHIAAVCAAAATGGSASARALAGTSWWIWPLVVAASLALIAAGILALAPLRPSTHAPLPPPAGIAADPTAAIEEAVLAPLRALRANDLAALAATMAPARRAAAEASWRRFAATADAARDAHIDRGIRTVLGEGGADRVLQAGTLPEDMRRGVRSTATLLARFAPGEVARLVGLLAGELDRWSESPPLAEEALLRASAEGRVAALRATGITDAAALRRLDFDGLLACASPAMAELKRAYRTCGLDFDAALDSVRVTVDRDGGSPVVAIGFTAFGAPHAVRTPVVAGEDGWRCPAVDALVDTLIAGTLLTAVPTGGDG